MKKYILLLIALISFSEINAQGDNQEWQFGANFMPFFYWKKNSFLDNHPHIQIQPTNKINGVYGGVFAEKYFNKNWGVKLAINYSKQRYDVKSMIIPKDSNGNWDLYNPMNYFDLKSENNFYYFLVPLTIQYAISFNENFYIIIGMGPQFSVFSKHDTYKYLVDRNGNFESIGGSYNFTNLNFYNKLLIGATAYSGVKFKISDAFNGFANVKYDYDFSNTTKGKISSIDNNPNEYGQLEITDPTLPYSAVNASKSHQMRLGVEFGLVYDFR